jgi:GTP-binding protein Era
MNAPSPGHRAGLVAVVGRPNVGKSTLVNALVGSKVSIVAPKPQTTRHRILGVCTRPEGQIVLVDTPGLHDAGGHAINRYLNRAARGALGDADAIALVVDARRWTSEDDAVLTACAAAGLPVVLVLNRIDQVKDRSTLLPRLEELSHRHDFAALVPVSALRRSNLADLERTLLSLLPEQPPLYAGDAITDRSERFLAGELIREQVVRQLAAELPYATTVSIDAFERERRLIRIAATIWVEREGQKAIAVGAGGAQIKRLGTSARLALQESLGKRVHLDLVVKVRERWSDDDAALRAFGYTDT